MRYRYDRVNRTSPEIGLPWQAVLLSEKVRPAPSTHSARTASEQVAEQVRSLIASGRVKPGEMLPSERQLLDTYDVARPTMRGHSGSSSPMV
jgi:hypothetical protein